MRRHDVLLIITLALGIAACGKLDSEGTKATSGGAAGADAAAGAAGESAGGEAGSSGKAGEAGAVGLSGAAGAGGAGGAGGSAGAGGAAGSAGSSGSGGDGGSSGGISDAGSAADADADDCSPPNANGAIEVRVSVDFYAAQVPATFHHDWNGSWPNSTTVPSSPATIVALMQPGLHKLNASLADGQWLVNGLPFSLSVPETKVSVRYGCFTESHPVALGASVTLPQYGVGYAVRNGAGDLYFCNSPGGCAF